MRVLLLNQFYAPDMSPTAQLAASLARHLVALGNEVTVVTSSGSYAGAATARASAAEEPAIVRVRGPQFDKGSLRRRMASYATYYAGACAAALRLPRHDIVIAMTTPPYLVAAGALHRLRHQGARLVLWCMDTYPDALERTGVIRSGGARSAALRRLSGTLTRSVDHVVCLDEAMADLVRAHVPQGAAPPITVIPNWEAIDQFPADAKPQPWAERAALGLEGRFVVLYLGNLGYGHHFDAALEAARRLAPDPVTFLFVGGGTRWEALRSAVQRRGLTNVVLHDYVPKDLTPSVMASADCALITLRDEGLGVMSPSKVHANLARGLPIAYLGPRRSNVDAAIERFACGASLRQDDAAGLVALIRSLLGPEGAARRAELSRNARCAFEQAYCDRATLPVFTALLRSLTAG